MNDGSNNIIPNGDVHYTKIFPLDFQVYRPLIVCRYPVTVGSAQPALRLNMARQTVIPVEGSVFTYSLRLHGHASRHYWSQPSIVNSWTSMQRICFYTNMALLCGV